MNKYVSLFALHFAILIVPGSAQAEDWPTFMHDNQRSGVTGERLKLPLKEAWVFEAAHQPQPAWPPPAQQDFYHRRYNLKPAVTYDRAFHVVGFTALLPTTVHSCGGTKQLSWIVWFRAMGD